MTRVAPATGCTLSRCGAPVVAEGLCARCLATLRQVRAEGTPRGAQLGLPLARDPQERR